ncbi:PREDICTED: cation/H(+) antiporter 15-like [Nicotiana attenuata]|uniref:Cationh(+) antiporter 15 n=1 Tax=Nicotiana attenuata TaxID=49451 RepID=A0A1J6IPS1_NICAT|nr:PREDICTED: cation/H(+) antiporter 15-like [Nicotiana attenuata]OIT00843.1 cationh(+) antiporter 15 [Nicotiana attenuata]
MDSNDFNETSTICFLTKHYGINRGVFFGDDPLNFVNPMVLAQISLCGIFTSLFQFFLAPLGVTNFVSQMLVGFVMGPSIIGSDHSIREAFFLPESFYVMDTLAYFGLMLFLFLVGVKMDLNMLWNTGRRAVIIGLATFLFPLLLCFIISQCFLHSLALEQRIHRSLLWVASLQSMSSFHVTNCLLTDLKLLNSEIGKIALSSSMISGTCAWFWISIIFTGKQSIGEHKKGSLLLMFFFVAIMFILLGCLVRPLVQRMARRSEGKKSVGENHIFAIFIMVMASALFGEIVGQHFLFGPMILGLAIPDGPPIGSALIAKLDSFISYVLLPLYVVISGTKLDFSVITWRHFGIIETLAVFSFLSKVVATMIPCLLSRMPKRDAFCLGVVLSCQGITDVVILQRAVYINLIDHESYTIMLLSIIIFAGVFSPVIKYIYNPSRMYATCKRRTMEDTKLTDELRLLACLHHQEHTPSIIKLLEATYPNPHNPVCFYVVHLIDLRGRATPTIVAHHRGKKETTLQESDHIINALRLYEKQSHGNITFYPFSAISPYATMHNDVCHLAMDKRAAFVVLPFHKHWAVHTSDVEENCIRNVNRKILTTAPCSVGVFIDRSTSSTNTPLSTMTNVYSIGVLFIGGQDDREALAYANRMAIHPNVGVTVVRLIEPKKLDKFNYTQDMVKDAEAINAFREANMNKKLCIYEEEEVKDSVGVVSVIRKMENCFDLIIVGRHNDSNSALLGGLREWSEFPELGFIGDMLASSDTSYEVSVLIVQQQAFPEDKIQESPNLENSAAVVNMRHFETTKF